MDLIEAKKNPIIGATEIPIQKAVFSWKMKIQATELSRAIANENSILLKIKWLFLFPSTHDSGKACQIVKRPRPM